VALVDTERFNVTDLSVVAQVAICVRQSSSYRLVTAGTPFGTFLRALKDSGMQVPLLRRVGCDRCGMQQSPHSPPSLFVATVPPCANAVRDRATKRQLMNFWRNETAGVKVDYVSTTCGSRIAARRCTA